MSSEAAATTADEASSSSPVYYWDEETQAYYYWDEATQSYYPYVEENVDTAAAGEDGSNANRVSAADGSAESAEVEQFAEPPQTEQGRLSMDSTESNGSAHWSRGVSRRRSVSEFGTLQKALEALTLERRRRSGSVILNDADINAFNARMRVREMLASEKGSDDGSDNSSDELLPENALERAYSIKKLPSRRRSGLMRGDTIQTLSRGQSIFVGKQDSGEQAKPPLTQIFDGRNRSRAKTMAAHAGLLPRRRVSFIG